MQPALAVIPMVTRVGDLFAVALDADASRAMRALAGMLVVAAAVGSKNALIGTSPGASSSG